MEKEKTETSEERISIVESLEQEYEKMRQKRDKYLERSFKFQCICLGFSFAILIFIIITAILSS